MYKILNETRRPIAFHAIRRDICNHRKLVSKLSCLWTIELRFCERYMNRSHRFSS